MLDALSSFLNISTATHAHLLQPPSLVTSLEGGETCATLSWPLEEGVLPTCLPCSSGSPRVSFSFLFSFQVNGGRGEGAILVKQRVLLLQHTVGITTRCWNPAMGCLETPRVLPCFRLGPCDYYLRARIRFRTSPRETQGRSQHMGWGGCGGGCMRLAWAASRHHR